MASVGSAQRPGPVLFAAVFPEFIAREKPGQRGTGRQGRSAGLVRPAAQRGHGLARLDGTRPRATVASKVMSSGKMAGQATAPSTADRTASASAQARSWKPGRRRQPSGVRERWKPEGGETPQAARCATRTTARPAISQVAGDAQTSMPKKQQDQDEHMQGIVDLPWMRSGRSSAAGSAVFRGAKPARRG